MAGFVSIGAIGIKSDGGSGLAGSRYDMTHYTDIGRSGGAFDEINLDEPISM